MPLTVFLTQRPQSTALRLLCYSMLWGSGFLTLEAKQHKNNGSSEPRRSPHQGASSLVPQAVCPQCKLCTMHHSLDPQLDSVGLSSAARCFVVFLFVAFFFGRVIHNASTQCSQLDLGHDRRTCNVFITGLLHACTALFQLPLPKLTSVVSNDSCPACLVDWFSFKNENFIWHSSNQQRYQGMKNSHGFFAISYSKTSWTAQG